MPAWKSKKSCLANYWLAPQTLYIIRNSTVVLRYALGMEETNTNTPSFSSFELPESLQQGLRDLGFSNCTEIQALSLPIALQGKDVTGQAQTGTGKTAAFLIATYAHLLKNPTSEDRKDNQVRALIVAPTRELAIQIHKDALQLGAHTGLSLGLAYGGVDYEKQRAQLAEGVDILVGTPGRIIDYLKQGVFDLKLGQVIVLDEADRMFDLGFIADIRFLLRRMPEPKQRLSMLFSATLSQRVLELAYEHMNDPESVKTESDQMTAEKVVQSLYHPAKEEKNQLLVHLLREMKPERSMVFVNTKVVADRLLGALLGNGFKADVLSGDVRQNKRQRLLGDFEAGKIDILIGTDVAARGLHVPGVTHVFNYDLPQQEEDYVHRIGRTARAGAFGEAISFACEEYAFSLPTIQEYIGQTIETKPITNAMLPELEKPVRIKRDPPPNRDGKGGKSSGGGRSSNGRGGNRSSGDGRRSGGGGRGGDNRNRGDKPPKKDQDTAAEAEVKSSQNTGPNAENNKSENGETRKRPRRRGGRNRNKNREQNANTAEGAQSQQQKPSAESGEGQSSNKPRRSRSSRNRYNRDGRKPRQDNAGQENKNQNSGAKQQGSSGNNTKPAAKPTESGGLFGKLKSAAKKIFGN